MYTKNDHSSYSNEDAAKIIQNEDHMDGFAGNMWSGEHPNFSPEHNKPFVVVIDLQTGYTIRASHARLIEGDDILEAVKKAAEN